MDQESRQGRENQRQHQKKTHTDDSNGNEKALPSSQITSQPRQNPGSQAQEPKANQRQFVNT